MIKRYNTEASFKAAIENGTILPFDYLQPEGQLSIDAVYIGTKAIGTHWVCYDLSPFISKRNELVSLTQVRKMLKAFAYRPQVHYLRFKKFCSIVDGINADADALVRLKSKLATAEAKAHVKYHAAKAAEAKAAEVNADTQPKIVGDGITAMVSIPQCDPFSGEWGLSEVKMTLIDMNANDVGTFRAVGCGERAYETFEVQL